MEVASELRELARNLYWSWQPDVLSVFRSLDPELWRQTNHNPVEFLARFPAELLEQRATELMVEARINFAFHRLRDYLSEERLTWGRFNAGVLRARPVAYFSAEFGLHESLPIYSGGLGVLAGDHLKSASDLGVPLVGIGLLYAQGYFTQVLRPDGWQTERYFNLPLNQLQLEAALDPKGQPIVVRVNTRSSTIAVKVWQIHVGRNTLILLDSDVPENSIQDRKLTSTLYGGDQNIRIRQELILGVGGLRALEAMRLRPGVLHLNEGHSAFAVLEQVRLLMEREGRSFDDVRDRVAGMTVFTTHTPAEAAHDRFSAALIEEVLGPLREQLGLSLEALMALGRVHPGDSSEPFCMTVLGLRMAARRNAVSALHERVARSMWRSLWPDTPLDTIPISHVTNGVHVLSWLSPEMANLYSRYLRQGWPERICFRETWEAISSIPDAEFWETQQILKLRLIQYLKRTIARQGAARSDAPAVQAAVQNRLRPEALTIGFARRFATYKRAGLLLHDLERLDRLVNNPRYPVQIIFAGKAHPMDEPAKRLVQQVVNVTRDPRFAGRVLFVENHDMNVSRHLVQGVDVWLNTPRRPLEACGTSGQKAVLNGGLNVSVLDGWWAEAYDGSNGFAIGSGSEHADPARQDAADADETFRVLEEEVVPCFYERDEHGVPKKWVKRQKRAIQTLAWRFNADRMVIQYVREYYLPAAGGSRC